VENHARILSYGKEFWRDLTPPKRIILKRGHYKLFHYSFSKFLHRKNKFLHRNLKIVHRLVEMSHGRIEDEAEKKGNFHKVFENLISIFGIPHEIAQARHTIYETLQVKFKMSRGIIAALHWIIQILGRIIQYRPAKFKML